MAFSKALTLPSGVTADYWRVNDIRLDFDGGSAHVTLALYVDAEARQAGKIPVKTEVHGLAIAPFKASGDARAIAYTVLKTPNPGVQLIPSEVEGEEPTEVVTEANWFADAVDC
jgi:hypothetical protein